MEFVVLYTSHRGSPSISHMLPPISPLDIIDGQRCTVQMANGFLYLDAAAAPAHALLGHDRLMDEGEAGDVGELLDGLSGDYTCSAILPDLDAAVGHARRMLQARGDDQTAIAVVDALDGEPPPGYGPRIVIESASLGRSGRWLASEGWSRKPTLVVVGESLSCGLPFGAVLAPGRPSALGLADRPDVGAASLRAVSRTIGALRRERVLDAVPSLGEYLRDRLNSVQRTCPVISDITFGPFMAAVSLKRSQTAVSLKRQLCERGVLVAADEGNRIVIAPPLVIRPAEIDVIVGALRGALNGTPTWRLAACCPACELSSSTRGGEGQDERFNCTSP